jgi:hypothetical protein
MQISGEREYVRKGFEEEVRIDRAGAQVNVDGESRREMVNLEDGEL